jgi:hypothetical protein
LNIVVPIGVAGVPFLISAWFFNDGQVGFGLLFLLIAAGLGIIIAKFSSSPNVGLNETRG